MHSHGTTAARQPGLVQGTSVVRQFSLGALDHCTEEAIGVHTRIKVFDPSRPHGHPLQFHPDSAAHNLDNLIALPPTFGSLAYISGI